MQPQVEEVAENRVRLTDDVPRHDVQHAVEHAAADLAGAMKIPGFRKGKVPMPVLISRVGKERLYAEAVESHIGGWFRNAAGGARVYPVAQPEFEFELPHSDEEDWRFTATVPVQPPPELPDWSQLEVPRAEPDAPEELVERELEALGYGDFKAAVGEEVIRLLAPVRERYLELRPDEGSLETTLREGAERARAMASETLADVRRAMGVGPPV